MARGGPLEFAFDPGDHFTPAEGLDEISIGTAPARIRSVCTLATCSDGSKKRLSSSVTVM